MIIALVASALRYRSPVRPRGRARGALLAACANALLLFLLRSVSLASLTQHSRAPAGLHAAAITSDADGLVQEIAGPRDSREEARNRPTAQQSAPGGSAPTDGSDLAVVLVIGASVFAVLADISLAFSLESGVSVLSTVIMRCSTQGVLGAAGIFHGLLAGDTFLKGSDWWACSPGLLCPALAGLTFGPLAVHAFAQSVKHSTLLLGATVRSTCWVVVALLAVVAHGQQLSLGFTGALILAFTGTCLFAWDSRPGPTGDDTDESDYDYRISNPTNGHDVLLSPVYQELSEDGHY